MGNAGPPVLNFFVARLKTDAHAQKKSSELFLRFKATDSSEDLTSNEAVLASFCYPLGPESVPAHEYSAHEEYTFTLTYRDGRRFQGFCRRTLPPAPKVGSKLRHPQVLCLITQYPWYDFYFKVLQVLESFLRSGNRYLDSDLPDIPLESPAGAFLRRLGRQLTPEPAPGQMIKVNVPNLEMVFGPDPPKFIISSSDDMLPSPDGFVELRVPTDCGNGKWNRGLSLARLLWHVPVPAMLTLISAMLLERRIILVAQSRDAVSAAVQAAAALLYPFKWHHIYLPLLPKTFMDYLTAPMPFMVGMPAAMLHSLRHIPMDEVTLIDLDLGKCDPLPGSTRDDAHHLPWRNELEAALSAAYTLLRSPTEYESSPVVAAIMQEYFCKLLSTMRRYIHPESAPAMRHCSSGPLASGGSESPHPQKGRSGRVASERDPQEDVLKGSGHVFEHGLFVNSFRRNDKAQRFLQMLRHSQMYEMYVQEELKAVSAAAAGSVDTAASVSTGTAGEAPDPFQERVALHLEKRKQQAATRLQNMPVNQSVDSVTKWGDLLKRHRRTDSESTAATAGGVASASRRFTVDSSAMERATSLRDFDPAMFFADNTDWTFEETPVPGPGIRHTKQSASAAELSHEPLSREDRNSSASSSRLSSMSIGSIFQDKKQGKQGQQGQHGQQDNSRPSSTSSASTSPFKLPLPAFNFSLGGSKAAEGSSSITTKLKDMWIDAKSVLSERKVEGSNVKPSAGTGAGHVVEMQEMRVGEASSTPAAQPSHRPT